MMIRKILFTLLSLTIVQGVVNGQAAQQYADAGTLPKIVPPSPEVASIANVAQISNSKFTGSASANVPLYTIKYGSLTHPIELRYSTNGLKVTETPSSVGMGWNLMAGGSISRIIHDEPDGASTYLPPPPNFGLQDQAVFNYVEAANLPNNDTEFDEYSISAGGLSGKFFIDATGTVRFTSHSNLKVAVSNPGSASTTFIVTAPDGSKYYFGGLQGVDNMIEQTVEIRANSKDTKFKEITTAWFLRQIVSSQGDVIQFNYTYKQVTARLGAFQQVVLNNQSATVPYGDCGFCDNKPIPSVDFNRIVYKSHYLTSISAGNISIYFNYEGRGDATGDNRLTGVLVNYSNGAGISYGVKHYQLEYENNLTEGTTFKYYLKKVIQSAPLGSNSALAPLAYEFQYNSGLLPQIESLGQDYYGYYGGSGGGNFFPRPPNYSQYVNGSQGIDRSPSFNAARVGALKKMIYPTGGYEEFEYEGHTLPEQQTNTTYSNAILVTPGLANEGQNIVSQNIYSSFDQTVPVTIISEANPAGPQNPPSDYNNKVKVEVLKNGTTSVFTATLNNWTTAQHSINLQAGFTYKIKLTVWDINNAGRVYLDYNPATVTQTVNIDACGIRVKKIASYDPVSNTTNNRYFKYSSLANPTLSSGVGYKIGSPFATLPTGGWCPSPSGLGQIFVECEPSLQISSSGLSGIYLFNGSPVAYKYVLESDDPNFTNGVTEYEYYAYTIGGGGAVLLNYPISATPVSVSADMNGMSKRTIVYRKEGNSFIKQQETENEYDYDSRVNFRRENYMVRKRWDAPLGDEQYFEKLKGYDVSQYALISSWIYLKKTTTKTYDPDGLNPVVQEVNNTYGSESHMQPTEITTYDSKSGTLVTNTKYPVDYPSTAPYTDMMAKNMQTAPIETSIKRNSTEQVLIKNNFAKWYDNGTNVVIAPSSAQASIGTNPLENKIVYNSYDNNGNVLQATGQDGVAIAFIWGYNKQFPVAKITGKTYADVISQSGIDLTIVNNPASVAAIRTELNKLYSVSDAFVTTNIYKPFIGVIEETDQRNRITYYEYDGFNRLSIVRDHDHNIIRRLCYNYAGQPENCLVTCINNNPDWQNTPTELRCVPSNCGGYTVYQEQQQRDINPCSPTFNQVRWIDAGYNPTACSTNTSADWKNTTTALRCQLEACGGYTGYQEQEQQDMNPCSPTFNQKRWVNAGYNPTACIKNTSPDWQNTTTPIRCQKNTCGTYTGDEEQEQRDMNPCSYMYNQTRWVVTGNNPSACVPGNCTGGIAITATNQTGLHYTVSFYNQDTGTTFSFDITVDGVQNIGSLPEGTYDVSISNTEFIAFMAEFKFGCIGPSGESAMTETGEGASFYNIPVAASGFSCTTITISPSSGAPMSEGEL